jgi:cell division protein FtsQ
MHRVGQSQPQSAPLEVRLMNLTSLGLTGVFVLLSVTVLVHWVAAHPVWTLSGVTVTGDVTHNNAMTLRANVAPKLKGTFLTLNLQDAQRAFESVPWVRSAVVKREFPNRLHVVLSEYQPVALWGAEGGSSLVDIHGTVFEANVGEVDQDRLPRLLGPDTQAVLVLSAYRALQPLFAQGQASIETLELTGRGSWRVQLETGARIELGRGSVPEIEALAARFIRTLPQVTARYGRRLAALESADLRHQAGYAIRLQGVSTVSAAKTTLE